MSGSHRVAAVSPNIVVCEVAGIPVVLDTVVLRASGLSIFLAGRRNDIAHQLETKWRSEVERAQSARKHGDAAPRAPEHPGRQVLASVPHLIIRDDLDTAYQRVGRQVFGPGSEWEVLWRFQPAVPEQAGSFTVLIEGDEAVGQAQTLQLERAMSDAHRSRAFSPDAVLGEMAGVRIVLEAVVLRAWGTLLFLGVRQTAITNGLQTEWRADFDEWVKRAKGAHERGEESPGHPKEPGANILGSLPLILRDDLGTVYRWAGTSAGGSGSEWDALWQFQPPVPPQARSLTVLMDPDEPGGQGRRATATVEAIAPMTLSL